MTMSSTENFGAALRVIEAVWSETGPWPFFGVGDGRQVDRLPDIGFEQTAKRASLGKRILARAAEIDAGSLPHDLPYTFEIARGTAERWSREEEWYWLLFDPTGVGFFAMFAPTAYAGGYMLNALGGIYRSFAFVERGDGDRYIALVRDYARLVRQMMERTGGQAERDILIPRPQLDQSLALLRGLQSGARQLLLPDASRLEAIDGADFLVRIADAIDCEVAPQFDAFIDMLSDDAYAAAAPVEVGIGQYPGGAAAYSQLIRLHTTLELSAQQVHSIGKQRINRIREEMQQLLAEIRFAGSIDDYVEQVGADPAWRGEGPEAVTAFFNRYIDRIAPHIEANFNFKPKAGHGVAPLPEALSSAMTFGYYAPQTLDQDKGLFIFNSVNLSKGPLNNIGALNYHELVPGHHFHLATQQENETLHPLRQRSIVNAYNEGWAEYAATFAGEIGMYREPEERFGRLMMDAFLTCRLVVDTGMNVLGWTIEEARQYLRNNGFMPEAEIHSETIRYSCDMPGQALAYKLGDTFLYDARERMRTALGDRFDIRDFHDAVLKPGALPLPLLKQHVERETERLANIGADD